MTGRTVIAVAHRLSTLRDFDRILVMDGGRIVQDGAPAALERAQGPYRELLRRQAFQVVEGGAADEPPPATVAPVAPPAAVAPVAPVAPAQAA